MGIGSLFALVVGALFAPVAATSSSTTTTATIASESSTTTTTITSTPVEDVATPSSVPTTTTTTTTGVPAVESELYAAPVSDPTDEVADMRDAWLSGSGGDVVATAGDFTVTPSTGLGYFGVVDVVAAGYAPSSLFGSVQCVAGASDVAGCFLDSLELSNTDAAGELIMPFTVRRFLPLVGGTVDCAAAPGTCVVIGGPTFFESLLNQEPLTFDPNAPIPPHPVIAVVPDADLGLETTVAVTGSGFVPNGFVTLRQCATGTTDLGDDCQFATGFAEVDSAGAIATDVVVRRGIRTGSDPVVDCVDAPGCELVAFASSDRDRRAATPLAFDPAVPLPPPPAVVATPGTGLVDFQLVTVSSSGFEPGEFVEVGQCAEGADLFTMCPPERGVEADAHGDIEVTFRVRRTATSLLIDCANAPGTCYVYVRSAQDVFGFGTAPLEFDPNAPPLAPPRVTVAPDVGLHDGEAVNVAGAGFTPGEAVILMMCIGNTDPIFHPGACGHGTERFVFADDTGTFQTTYPVRRWIPTFPAGEVDCVLHQLGCALGWVAPGDSEFAHGRTPLTFAPDPATPPGGLPRTGAPAGRWAALGGGLALLGGLFLLTARRARPALEWQSGTDAEDLGGDGDADGT